MVTIFFRACLKFISEMIYELFPDDFFFIIICTPIQ
jgi:hypothetical protein